MTVRNFFTSTLLALPFIIIPSVSQASTAKLFLKDSVQKHICTSKANLKSPVSIPYHCTKRCRNSRGRVYCCRWIDDDG
jgi:hypothetical protein